MSIVREIHRYTAYFKGWCQAFGEHETEFAGDEVIGWLYGEKQIGLILPHILNKQLYRNILGKIYDTPEIKLSRNSIVTGDFYHTFSDARDLAGLLKLIHLLEDHEELHLYLTYHFIYPKGTRITTFSAEKPLPLIYKEIEPIQICLS